VSENYNVFFSKQYRSNLVMLLQLQGGKFRSTVTVDTSYVGDGAAPVNQMGAVEMQEVTGRFQPMGRVDAPTARRWVHPRSFDLPQMVDNLDILRSVVGNPNSSYVQNGVKAAGRQSDRLIIQAFFASAKTGVAGAGSTAFTAGNEIDVAVGGSNSRLNVEKIKALRELMESQYVDFDEEEVYIGITAKDHSALLSDIQIISRDFKNGESPVLEKGKVREFLGFNFLQSELIETLCAGTNEVTLPAWCKSGMHLGVWQDMQTDVSQRKDLQSLPWQIYQTITQGATRLEENKVYAVESYRA
jgi:hypothetical protein